MGMLGKLAFWKKEEDSPANDTFKFDTPEGPDHSDSMHNPFLDERHDTPEEPSPLFDQKKPFQVQSMQSTAPLQTSAYDMNLTNKNIEIVSAKLDALKSELEIMSQRLKNIEAIAVKEQQPQQSQASMPQYRRYQQW